nr:DNA/RNA non-specific endonuclease [uncultured Shinella sp.]
MIDETDTSAAEGKFSSLGDIRVAHLELMRQASENETLIVPTPDSEMKIKPSTDAIRLFLTGASQAGRTIERESDRRSVQRILDYWCAELVTRPVITKADISPTRLAPFEGDREAEASPAGAVAPEAGDALNIEVNSADDGLTEDEEAERLRIRVAAQARQWENTRYDGYLLRDQALTEAAKLPKGPDIDAFIQASEQAQEINRKHRDTIKNLLIAGSVCLSAILAILAFYAFLQARNADVARKESEAKAGEILVLNNDLKKQVAATKAAWTETQRKADEITKLNTELQARVEAYTSANDVAVKAVADAERARLQMQDALNLANQQFENTNKRVTELEAAQSSLDTALGLIVAGVVRGGIQIGDLKGELRDQVSVQIVSDLKGGKLTINQLPPSLRVLLAPLIDNVPNVLPEDLPGYQASFLDTKIQLPTIRGEQTGNVLPERLDYLNYSLVMSKANRMALYAAVNLDRSQRLILQTAGTGLRPDARLPISDQPDAAWYDSVWKPVQLASSGDVAWGTAFSGDAGTAALTLSLYTSVLPNSLPQPAGLAAGLWPQLENWVRSEHNPLANRVTIFTGPVFGKGSEAQGTDGVPVPVAYWKVAVSSVSIAVKGEIRDPEFKVDAFLIPRDTEATDFKPSMFRISISDLEQRTDLDFGYLIRWTDSMDHPASNGVTLADELAGRVGLLDSGREGERQAIKAELRAVLGNADLPIAERRKVVAALTDMAKTVNMLPLSRDGRLNVLEALTWVPDDLWRRPDWLTLWAQARVAAGDLEVREASGETNIGQQTRTLLDRVKAQVGIRPSTQKVYLQFAGMPRPVAQTLSARMRAVGWLIPSPGEERTALAAGKNEVRYNPDSTEDRAAAEMLAADLTAAGQAVEAKPISAIGKNTLEIWISR